MDSKREVKRAHRKLSHFSLVSCSEAKTRAAACLQNCSVTLNALAWLPGFWFARYILNTLTGVDPEKFHYSTLGLYAWRHYIRLGASHRDLSWLDGTHIVRDGFCPSDLGTPPQFFRRPDDPLSTSATAYAGRSPLHECVGLYVRHFSPGNGRAEHHRAPYGQKSRKLRPRHERILP